LHTRFYPSLSIFTTLPPIYILPITPHFIVAYMDKCRTPVYRVMRFHYFDYAATKQTTSTYCNYNSWQLTSFYILYLIINNGHMNILTL